MRAPARRIVSVYAIVILLSAGFGIVQGPSPRTLIGALGDGLTGAIIGILLTAFEIQMRDVWPRQIRRLFKPLQVVLIRFSFYVAVFYLVPGVVAWAAQLIWPQIDARALVGDRHVALYFAFAILVNLFMAIRRMLGGKNLMALATGRYRRPREEEHIVAFLDLKGSTPLAERLGAARYHDFLNDVFFDLADPIVSAGASVYQYVGDEVVVTWPVARGLRNADCVKFLFAVDETLARRRAAYEQEFAAAPALRGALHIGTLMVGEIGDLNRQIVMIGDTMNTTARIEGACRQFGRDYVCSAAVLVRLGGLPEGIVAESLGPVALAGKAGQMDLFALVRAAEVTAGEAIAAPAEPLGEPVSTIAEQAG